MRPPASPGGMATSCPRRAATGVGRSRRQFGNGPRMAPRAGADSDGRVVVRRGAGRHAWHPTQCPPPGGRVGILGAAPAALAGWVDWAEQHEDQMRTGLVHAASIVTAPGLYSGSWVQRGRGRTTLGKALGFAGLCAAGTGRMLGGHLAYRLAAGANRTTPVPHLLEEGCHPVGTVEDFPVGAAVRRVLGEVPLLVFRQPGGHIRVLAERCSHLSGPLSDGKIADGCVECPWRGSAFRLSDGVNARGPATLRSRPSKYAWTAMASSTYSCRAPAEHTMARQRPTAFLSCCLFIEERPSILRLFASSYN